MLKANLTRNRRTGKAKLTRLAYQGRIFGKYLRDRSGRSTNQPTVVRMFPAVRFVRTAACTVARCCKAPTVRRVAQRRRLEPV